MKKFASLVVVVTICSTLVSIPPFLGTSSASNEASASSASCADVCGYAVIDDSGVVHGVIVCEQGCFNGVMPIDYMGCPAGCSLVLQSPADSTGNVAGVHGPDVIYNSDNNTFSRVDEDGNSWTHVGGEPLNSPVVTSPPPSQPAPPSTEAPSESPTVTNPSSESTTPPSTSSPEPSNDSTILEALVDYLTQTHPEDWPTDVSPDVQSVIDEFYEYLREIVLDAWPDYWTQTTAAR
jgi:hypothetical protein